MNVRKRAVKALTGVGRGLSSPAHRMESDTKKAECSRDDVKFIPLNDIRTQLVEPQHKTKSEHVT